MSKKMLGDLMRQAQKMQEEMQKSQDAIKLKTVEATAGGGMVTVTANGGGEILTVKLEKDVVSPDDVEMLQDLIVAAMNEVQRRVQVLQQEEMGKVAGGMGIPGGLGGLGGLFGG